MIFGHFLVQFFLRNFFKQFMSIYFANIGVNILLKQTFVEFVKILWIEVNTSKKRFFSVVETNSQEISQHLIWFVSVGCCR